jgi:hypothetical protein
MVRRLLFRLDRAYETLTTFIYPTVVVKDGLDRQLALLDPLASLPRLTTVNACEVGGRLRGITGSGSSSGVVIIWGTQHSTVLYFNHTSHLTLLLQ